MARSLARPGCGRIVKRTNPFRQSVRWCGRIGALSIAVLIVALVGIQFTRAIAENVAMSRKLASIRAEVATMQEHQASQRAEIRRLQDPLGAIPEIHDRLRLVRANEAIIFVSPAPSTTP
jgi:cell division protein FtsB